MADQVCPLDTKLFKQSLNCLGKERQRIGAAGLGRLAEAREVEGDRARVGLERRQGSSPRLGEPTEPVDQHGDRTVPSGGVVKVEAVYFSPPEPDSRHVGSS
jgi:hypothetical protein